MNILMYHKKVFWLLSVTGILLIAGFLFADIKSVSAQTGNRSKSAFNITQGRNAESVDAHEGDEIEYTLTFRNTQSRVQHVRIEDNISDVLRLAGFIDDGDGDLVSDTVRFREVAVGEGNSISRSFRVRVDFGLDGRRDLTMENTYGDTVFIEIDPFGDSNFFDDDRRSKSAFNQTQGEDAEAVNARPGDLIEYRLTFFNDSSRTRTVTISDDISDVLELAVVTSFGGGSMSGSAIRFPTQSVAAFRSIEKKFQVLVKDFNFLPADNLMTNTYGDTVVIRVRDDDDNNFRRTSNIGSDIRSKSAFNRTQGRDAESVAARPGDVIDYTLTYRNRNSSGRTVTFDDDISDVLDLAEIISFGGGQLVGDTIRFNDVFVPSNSRVDRIFQVRVKQVSASRRDLLMSNFFGNGIDIQILPTGAVSGVTFVPPKGTATVKGTTFVSPATGPKENFALLFALLLTGGMLVYNKRAKLKVLVRERRI